MKIPRQLIVSDNAESMAREDGEITWKPSGDGGPHNSNLATPTIIFPQDERGKPFFSALKMSVADNRVIKRKPLVNAKGYPYYKARLVHHNRSLTKKWLIVFYAWDIGLERLVRKRYGKKELNSIVDINERTREADRMVREINHALKEGAYLETSERKTEVSAYDFHGYTLLNAITYVHNFARDIERRKYNTLRQYRYLINLVTRFLKQEDLGNGFPLRKLNRAFVNKFTEFMKDQELSNKTHNGAVTMLHGAVEKLRKLDDRLFPDKNPVVFNNLKTVSRVHAAYTEKQLKEFSEAIAPRDPQLLLFIRFIYFTLARPYEEVRSIRVGHISLEHRRVLIDGGSAKTGLENYVGISKAFEKTIRDSNILDCPDDHFVFGRDGTPGPKRVGRNFFYKRFRSYMDDLGFKKLNDRYTMYSFKHSGAIGLYLESKDIELLRKQCRHTTIAQTSRYLTELGLFTDFSGLDGWKGF